MVNQYVSHLLIVAIMWFFEEMANKPQAVPENFNTHGSYFLHYHYGSQLKEALFT